MTNRKKIAIVAIVVIGVATILGIKMFSAEDTWVCSDGKWVAQGNPSEPQPAVSCNSENILVDVPSDTYCQKDADCACGVHRNKGNCFVGNSNFVNIDQQCPDFCTGIDGSLKIACAKNECVLRR